MTLNKNCNAQINITDLWGKYEKICVKIYVEHFKKFHDK